MNLNGQTRMHDGAASIFWIQSMAKIQELKRSEAVWKKDEAHPSRYFTGRFVLCGNVKPTLIVSFYIYNVGA